MIVRRSRRNPNSSSKGNLLPKVPPTSHPIFPGHFPKGLLVPQAGLEAHQGQVLDFRIDLGLRVASLVVLAVLAVLVLSLGPNTE